MNKDEDPDDSGAGMIGDVDYNSCCYYEYASIDTDILYKNLKNAEDPLGLAKQLIPTLIRAMAMANPSGKQNTFAGQVLPDLVMVECKKDKIPLSYVNAFEVPVKTWGSQPNVVENSVIRLKEQVDLMDEAYELPVEARAFFAPKYADCRPAKCDVYHKFSELTQAVGSWL